MLRAVRCVRLRFVLFCWLFSCCRFVRVGVGLICVVFGYVASGCVAVCVVFGYVGLVVWRYVVLFM